MRAGRSSSTSSLVTLMRALAHAGLSEVRGFSDATALAFLSRRWRLAYDLITRRYAVPERRARLLARARGRLDVVALRTRVIDDAWHAAHAAHAAGARQLVLLGAGFDGRAFRLEDVGDTAVFEVDHRATQAVKRERARRLTARAGRHVYVPVDFERDPLADALAAAGHSASAPTFFVWEGVTTYLTAAAQTATMRAIYERAAPGSRLVMTYVVPDANRRFAGLRFVFSLAGEPVLGEMSRATAAERLAGAGLRVVEDTGVAEWRRRYADPSRDADVVPARIALAVR